MEKIFAQYYEDLLRAQYRVSEMVQQNLPKGTIREDFLRELVLGRKGSLRGKKGIVSKNGNQSGECDLIFHEISATVQPLGEQIIIDPKYCKLVLEVKSNATSGDIKKSEKNFKVIKEMDPNNPPLCGVFCYNTSIEKKTTLSKFGWIYDDTLESWEENTSLKIEYSNIDFIIDIACVEEDEFCTEKQFFLIKDKDSERYVLQQEYPIIKNFFGVTDNL
ncbi:MAG: hypothetical protein KBC50_00015 [Candidatus Pacebacteria bacterium]|nr:hypothetical protein [Candidatus Paceibacterota bacterium]